MKNIKLIIWLLSITLGFETMAVELLTSTRAQRSIESVESMLKPVLSVKSLKYGAPIFIRIFKQPGVLKYRMANMCSACSTNTNSNTNSNKNSSNSHSNKSTSHLYFIAMAR